MKNLLYFLPVHLKRFCFVYLSFFIFFIYIFIYYLFIYYYYFLFYFFYFFIFYLFILFIYLFIFFFFFFFFLLLTILLKLISNVKLFLVLICLYFVIATHANYIASEEDIVKTYLYNFDPLKPHFYIVKLGFTGVCIIFSYFCLKA